MTGSLDFSGLGDLAQQSPEKTKQGWQPLTREDLGYGTVLCFDQSLTATGTLIVSRTYPADLPQVLGARQFKNLQEGRPQGVATWLDQGVDVFEAALSLMNMAKVAGHAVVHESPPNPGAIKKGNSVSSLLAAQGLRCAAKVAGVDIEMLGAQPAKKLVCGNANADKKTAHAELKLSVLPWIVNSQMVTNEATRDSLMLGLLWLARRK